MSDDKISVTVELSPECAAYIKQNGRAANGGMHANFALDALKSAIPEPVREPEVGERWLVHPLTYPSTILAKFSTIHGERHVVFQEDDRPPETRPLAWVVDHGEYLGDGDLNG